MKKTLFTQYISHICRLYQIKEQELFSRSKKHALSEARHLLYYLCYERKIRIIDIQTYMEESGYKVQHSSVIHGIRGIKKRVANDMDYANVTEKIQDSVTI
ncbi:dnaA [Caudoviricetes sp.]|nr:dnaA [Caudoviricetes sp.]